MINLDYDVYQGIEHLDKVASCSSLSFDTETLQLKPEMGKLRLLQLGSAARRCVVLIDLFACDDEDLETLGLFFTNGERFWLAHNAAFDLAWLQTYGWVPRGQVRCSMLASRLLLNGVPKAKHNLLEVARRMLDIALDKEEQRSDWSKDLSDSQLTYAAKDVMVLARWTVSCTATSQLGWKGLRARVQGAPCAGGDGTHWTPLGQGWSDSGRQGL